MLLGAASWAQNGGVVPPPDIVGATNQNINSINQANTQAAQAALLRQQTALLKQQTKALKQQNELRKQQQAAALASPVTPPATRKPRVDDLDPVTGQPRFATFAEYEDAKDEWLIEEALRRFQALLPPH